MLKEMVCEIVNGTLMKILTTVIQEQPQDWRDYMLMALYAYRTSYHQSIKMSPFLALFGRQAKMPSQLPFVKNPKLKEKLQDQLKTCHEKIDIIQNKANENYKAAQKR